jgi:hypothetical protein
VLPCCTFRVRVNRRPRSGCDGGTGNKSVSKVVFLNYFPSRTAYESTLSWDNSNTGTAAADALGAAIKSFSSHSDKSTSKKIAIVQQNVSDAASRDQISAFMRRLREQYPDIKTVFASEKGSDVSDQTSDINSIINVPSVVGVFAPTISFTPDSVSAIGN